MLGPSIAALPPELTVVTAASSFPPERALIDIALVVMVRADDFLGGMFVGIGGAKLHD